MIAVAEVVRMVHFCVVPGCANKSNRNKQLSFHRLPLNNNRLLCVWIHKIGRKNLPLNDSSRVCSAHFENCGGRLLRPHESPCLKLPKLPTQVSTPSKRRSPKMRSPCLQPEDYASPDSQDDNPFLLMLETKLTYVVNNY